MFATVVIVNTCQSPIDDEPLELSERNGNGEAETYESILTLEEANCAVRAMAYLFHGPVRLRFIEMRDLITKSEAAGKPSPFPFGSIINLAIGDPQSLGQKPLTFTRQVLSGVANPDCLESGSLPADVVSRCRALLSSCRGGSIGSYSDSHGNELIRRHVAEFIERRDGIPSDPNQIIISAGATECLRMVLKLFIRPGADAARRKVGVMTPIPQFPFYESTNTEFGLGQVSYYLDEDDNWALNVEELERALENGNEQFETRVLVVCNPGNPTGQVLTRANMEEIVRFAYRRRLFLMADEVYQENIYDPACAFISFKRVLHDMGEPMQLTSFHSASKGLSGECGARGGYVEFVNIDDGVIQLCRKAYMVKMCPSIYGQVALDCVVSPPSADDASFSLHNSERQSLLSSFARRARLAHEAFNSVDGVTCNPIQAGMFAFPRLHLLPGALKAAADAGLSPDDFYVRQLLEATGIFALPGEGFGQKEGTFHLRITILPPEKAMEDVRDRFPAFHKEFVERFA